MNAAPPARGAPILDIERADKVYANGTRALDPVDLAVRSGDFVTLLGPSGCGKSTLLKMAAGLLEATSGRIAWHVGGETGASPASHAMSFVFQEPTLMPWTTVDANVRLPLELEGVQRAQCAPTVASALALVGLDGFEASYPRQLSGGMQMRVSIARALVTEPTVMLMDEPFGALDEFTRNKLDADLLAMWQARALTVMFVTHSIYEAVFLSTRVVVMAARPGRVIGEIAIEEPYPRDDAFRVSTRFADYARRATELLTQASRSQPATTGAG